MISLLEKGTVTRPVSLNYPPLPVRVSECWLYDVMIMYNRYSRTVSASEMNIYYGPLLLLCRNTTPPPTYCQCLSPSCTVGMAFRVSWRSIQVWNIIWAWCPLILLWCRNMNIERILHCKVSLYMNNVHNYDVIFQSIVTLVDLTRNCCIARWILW